MKRIMSIVVTLCIMAMFTSDVVANSGPIARNEFPTAEQYVVDKNSPITITSENLIFDFVSNKFNATYVMENPTEDEVSAKMAFPYVGGSRYSDAFSVTSDDVDVPFKMYFGANSNIADGSGNKLYDLKTSDVFNFDSIVSSIEDKPYVPQKFERGTNFTLYTIEAEIFTETPLFMAIDLQFDTAKTKIVQDGFNYESSDGVVKLSSMVYKNNDYKHQLYVIGEDIDFVPKLYSDSDRLHEVKDVNRTITKHDLGVYSYIMDGLEIPENTSEMFWNIYAKSFDNLIKSNSFFSKSNIFDDSNTVRVNSLVYKIVFPPHSKKTVSVDFEANLSWTREKTSTPIYELNYIFNPAGYWSSFQNLTVEIIPPKDAPFIIESSLSFQRSKDGKYSAFISELPQEDLLVSFYYNNKVSQFDKIEGALHEEFGYFTPIVVFIFLAIIVICLIAIVSTLLKKKRKAKDGLV